MRGNENICLQLTGGMAGARGRLAIVMGRPIECRAVVHSMASFPDTEQQEDLHPQASPPGLRSPNALLS